MENNVERVHIGRLWYDIITIKTWVQRPLESGALLTAVSVFSWFCLAHSSLVYSSASIQGLTEYRNTPQNSGNDNG